MREKTMIAGTMTLLVLALAILFSQGAAGQALEVQADLTVTKSVDKPAVAPGEQVVYTVMISNTTDAPVEVPSVVDTLPDGFGYVGLAWNSDWHGEPWDSIPPDIQWNGPIPVPANDSLALRYWVHVPEGMPLGPEPYTNTVIVSDTYQAEAALVVGVGEVLVEKTAVPIRVRPGNSVTYTATFNNDGYAPLQLAKITDALPDDVTFVKMTSNSDVSNPPSGVAGTITWTGPFTVPDDEPLVLEYVTSMPTTEDTLYLQNMVSGQLGDGTVVTDSVEIKVSDTQSSTIHMPLIALGFKPPHFAISKKADPVEVAPESPGELVTYEVVITNKGTLPGELSQIRDTLPAGFTFVRMLSGPPPSSTSSPITWNGPVQVTGESSLTLRYEVRASSALGTYTNSVVATVSKGTPSSVSATASVEVKEPFLLIEEWTNPSPYWEEYTNYWRNNEEQWFIRSRGSEDGSAALAHQYYRGVSSRDRGAHDALIMFKGPGAEQWTDYTFEAWAGLLEWDPEQKGQFGMWFRGTGNQVDQIPGKYVTGYYFILKPREKGPGDIYLMQLRTDQECGDDCAYNYDFRNPLLLAHKGGNEDLDPLGLSIKVGNWYVLKVDVEGPRIRCYVNNKLVFDYYDNVGTTFSAGTVGFFTYIAEDARFDHVTVKSK